MTENKRFQVYKVSGNFGEWEVEDTLTDTIVMDKIMHKYLADRLCEKLNELNDENEQLKSELGKLNILYKAKCKTEEQLLEMGKEVEKENKQLKQSNQKLNDELQETMGYLALKSGVEKENEQLKKQIERIDFILDDLNGAEYISRDDGIKALNKIDKVIGKR